MTTPLPLRLVALSLALPLIWLAGRVVAGTLGGDRRVRDVVTPAVGVSLWLLAIHIAGRITRSFSTALVAGTMLVAIFGAVGAWRAHVRAPRGEPSPRGPGLSGWMLVGAAAAVAIMAPIALRWALHDELYVTGHMSIPAQMQNGVYPPRHLTFPEFELRYHYGFDLLVAVTSTLTRLRIDHAIDAVMLACWGYAWCLAWVLGERVVGRSGLLVATVTLFGGGLPSLCAPEAPWTPATLVGACRIEGMWPNPPVTSYIFQHPWTLGIPIGLAALLVATDRRCRAAPRLAVLGLLLTMLSMSQFVLFLTLTASLAAQEVFSSGLVRRSVLGRLLGGGVSLARALGLLLTIAVVLLVARRLGGFFTPPPDGASSGLIVHLGIAETLWGTVKWLFITYGVLLPLGLLGLVFLPRVRILLAALIVGSIAVLCSFRVAHSWDIVKFGTVAALSLSLSASAAIGWIGTRRPRLLSVPLAAALLVAGTAAGFAYPILFGAEVPGIPGMYHKRAIPLVPQDEAAVSWLRAHVAPGDVVYRQRGVSLEYALWGGLPQVWVDKNVAVFGFSDQRIAARKRLFTVFPDDPDVYLAQHVRWLVLDVTDDLLKLRVEGWIARGRARQVLAPGTLRVVEILPP